MTAKTKPNFSYFKRITAHRLWQLRCARQVHCWTKSASHPCNDLIAPGMRPAQRAACLYKTAPAIHRLPAPRCPGAEVAFLVKRPALHFLGAVFRHVAGDLVRPGHAEAETVRVADADLAHLFAVRGACGKCGPVTCTGPHGVLIDGSGSP